MNQYTYLLILAASLFGPLSLSFDRKVCFYRKWKYVAASLIIPAAIYIAWDMWFTEKQVWAFNPEYITGFMIYNLPVEEVLFFFIIPFCCTFIYECVITYFPRIRCTAKWDYVLGLIALILLAAGLVFRERLYTTSSFLFTSLFIAVILCFRQYFRSFNTPAFLLSYSIILIPFLIVNGFLTSIPIVTYNDAENLGIRIYTIPAEDIIYGMLMVMMNITIYCRLKRNREDVTSSRKT